ncbi:MAG: PhnB protein, partial [Limisphaerales bacterium]
MSNLYRTVTPYLIVNDVRAQMQFLTEILGATLHLAPKVREDESVLHTEIKVGDSIIMLGEPTDQDVIMPGSFYVMVDDADKRYKMALAAGAKSIMDPVEMEQGHRYGGIRDFNGNHWWMASE